MDDELVSYTVDQHVANIVFNRPEKANAVNTQLRGELLQQVNRACADSDVRVVVLSAQGKHFCVGADLEQQSFFNVEEAINKVAMPTIDAMHTGGKIFITALNGAAAGVGAAFALASDLCVMADDAYLYLPFSKIGLVPDGGTSWHLVRSMGYKRAMQAVLDAERLDASTCLEYRMVNKVVSAAHLKEETFSWAHEIASKAPRMLEELKVVMRQSMQDDLVSTVFNEGKSQGPLSETTDFREGVSAFFEKREPVFKGE